MCAFTSTCVFELCSKIRTKDDYLLAPFSSPHPFSVRRKSLNRIANMPAPTVPLAQQLAVAPVEVPVMPVAQQMAVAAVHVPSLPIVQQMVMAPVLPPVVVPMCSTRLTKPTPQLKVVWQEIKRRNQQPDSISAGECGICGRAFAILYSPKASDGTCGCTVTNQCHGID